MLPHAREYDGDGRGLVVWWLMREACLVETAVPDTPEDIKKREEEKKKDERAAAVAPNFGGSNQVLSRSRALARALSLSLSLSVSLSLSLSLPPIHALPLSLLSLRYTDTHRTHTHRVGE